jgi:hypothetical protein
MHKMRSNTLASKHFCTLFVAMKGNSFFFSRFWKVEMRIVILWENGWGGLGGYERIFLLNKGSKLVQKKIRVNLPNPPHPFSHSITKRSRETRSIYRPFPKNLVHLRFLPKIVENEIS